MDNSSELRIAVVGAGEWAAKYHLPAIKSLSRQQRVSIVGIWNRTRPKAEGLAAQFGLPKVYHELEDLLDESHIDCMAVVVNSQALGDILRLLVKRNLPVICEKPPGRDGEEARELAQLVVGTNVVAFNRRYMPLNRQFKTIVDECGDIDFVDCSFYRRHRNVENFVTETGIHAVNLLEYLFGRIVKVETDRWPVAGSETYNWIASLKFFNGLRGLIKFFPCAGINLESVEINGQKITASVSTAHPFTDDPSGSIRIDIDTENGERSAKIVKQKDIDSLTAGGFVGEYRDFFEAVRNKQQTVSNFQNAWRSMVISEAIQYGTNIEL
jgi:predicted dehydrogenase